MDRSSILPLQPRTSNLSKDNSEKAKQQRQTTSWCRLFKWITIFEGDRNPPPPSLHIIETEYINYKGVKLIESLLNPYTKQRVHEWKCMNNFIGPAIKGPPNSYKHINIHSFIITVNIYRKRHCWSAVLPFRIRRSLIYGCTRVKLLYRRCFGS